MRHFYNFIFAGIFWGLSISFLQAQSNNEAQFRQLLQQCATEMNMLPMAFNIKTTALPAPLFADLIQIWQGQNKKVFEVDSTSKQTISLPLLHLQLQKAEVRYQIMRRNQAKRNVIFTWTESLKNADGEIQYLRTCYKTAEDIILTKQISALENIQLPFTQGSVEIRKSASKGTSVAILSATVGITTYLLFSVRSKKSE